MSCIEQRAVLPSRTAPLQFSRGEGLGERGNRVALAVSFGRVSTTGHVTPSWPPVGTDASSLTATRMVGPCTS